MPGVLHLCGDSCSTRITSDNPNCHFTALLISMQLLKENFDRKKKNIDAQFGKGFIDAL